MKTCRIIVSLGFLLTLISCGTDINRKLAPGDTGTTGGASTDVSKVAAVQLSPANGYYLAPIQVNAQTSTAGATIYCTEDGSDPTVGSAIYAGPIQIDRSTILKCRAFKSEWTSSDIAEGLYVIEGTPTTGNGLPVFHKAKIDISLGVDNTDEIRIQNGIMDLVHVLGDRPGDPVVSVTKQDGSVEAISPWKLDPFKTETGFSCNWAACVSAPLDLNLTDFLPGGFGYVPASSLNIGVARIGGSVTVNSQNRIVIHDGPSSWSGYWFTFEYDYTTSAVH